MTASFGHPQPSNGRFDVSRATVTHKRRADGIRIEFCSEIACISHSNKRRHETNRARHESWAVLNFQRPSGSFSRHQQHPAGSLHRFPRLIEVMMLDDFDQNTLRIRLCISGWDGLAGCCGTVFSVTLLGTLSAFCQFAPLRMRAILRLKRSNAVSLVDPLANRDRFPPYGGAVDVLLCLDSAFSIRVEHFARKKSITCLSIPL